MSRNDSKIAFERSPEWALARSVERDTCWKAIYAPRLIHSYYVFFCLNVPRLVRPHYVRRPNISRLRRTNVRMPTLLQLCPLRLVFDAINAIERCTWRRSLTSKRCRGLSVYALLDVQAKKKPTREINLKWVMLSSITRSRNHPSRRHRNRRRSLHPQESNS